MPEGSSPLPPDLAALLVQYLPRLRGFLRICMGPTLRQRESASDLVQSVAREVLAEAKFEYRGEAEFREWLFQRARHKAMQKLRLHTADKRDVHRAEALPEHSAHDLLRCYQDLCTPSQVVADHEAVARVERAMDELPEAYREALVLHKLAGMSQREVGAAMGRSEGAVRNLVYRGLAELGLRLAAGNANAG